MTTAFVLSGGGSLGAVQVGMLLALAERDITPDLVVGTSVGAINAAWVAGRPGLEGALPRVTFSDPEVGSVGLSQIAAAAKGLRVRVGTSQIPHSARGWIHKDGNEGFIKLVEDADRGVLVGATSVGPTGGEVLGMLTLAVHAQIPTDVLGRMIYAYPTFHRAVEDALRNLADIPT
jgi:pyruvate/2-oxoglutarate dehydrogenase complex dihydrolipoamide dehydrogenase (E3) component